MSARTPSRAEVIGFFGGSFDPPHLGHLLAGAMVLAVHPDMRLLLVPSVVHPLGKGLSPFEHRYAMCRRLADLLPGSHVSRVEDRIGGRGRTLETLHALKTWKPSAHFRLVIGQDVYAERRLWHRFDEVCRLAPPIVVGRLGAPEVDVEVTPPIPDVSSTDIRDRIRKGLAVDHLVPASILAYIEKHGLYRP